MRGRVRGVFTRRRHTRYRMDGSDRHTYGTLRGKGQSRRSAAIGTGCLRLSFSPDGKTLASASEDGDVFLWDLATGNATAVPGHTESVWGMVFSPDGSTLASRAGTSRGKVNIWDVATGLKTVTLGGHEGPVRTVSYSPDGATLATGSHDMTVKLWDLDRNSAFVTLRHSNEVTSSSFSPRRNNARYRGFQRESSSSGT